MSSSNPPPAPTVGKELGSALQALNGGGAGTLFQTQAGEGSSLAQLNTGLNLANASSLSKAFFGPNGFDQMAQTQAEGLGNQFLGNQYTNAKNFSGGITSMLNANNPYASTLESAATGKSFLGAGVNPTMTSIENAQSNLGSSINPTLSDLSAVMATGTGAPNLLNTADTELSYGTSLTPTEQAQISQASGAADSSRGIFNSNTSAFNETLAEGTFGQTLLQQREQAAGTASGLAQSAVSGAAGIESTGLGLQESALTGASNTQASALQQQFQRNNAGLAQLANLTSLGNQNALTGLNFTTSQSGAYGAGLGASLFGTGLNTLESSVANPTPSFFNSMGLFSAAQDNAITAYNGSFAAQEQNAQAGNSLLGAGIGAGASILGSTSSSWAPALFSGIGAALAAL